MRKRQLQCSEFPDIRHSDIQGLTIDDLWGLLKIKRKKTNKIVD